MRRCMQKPPRVKARCKGKLVAPEINGRELHLKAALGGYYENDGRFIITEVSLVYDYNR